MKKNVIVKSLLVLLPVLAVALATTVNSVTVFDTLSGTTEYYSYLDAVPVENLAMLPPLAAILSLASGILAAIYLGKKKVSFLTWAGYTAFAAAVAAGIPIAMRGEVLVIPHVALPVFMLLQYGVSWYVGRQEKEEAARQLPKRKKKK